MGSVHVDCSMKVRLSNRSKSIMGDAIFGGENGSMDEYRCAKCHSIKHMYAPFLLTAVE